MPSLLFRGCASHQTADHALHAWLYTDRRMYKSARFIEHVVLYTPPHVTHVTRRLWSNNTMWVNAPPPYQTYICIRNYRWDAEICDTLDAKEFIERMYMPIYTFGAICSGAYGWSLKNAEFLSEATFGIRVLPLPVSVCVCPCVCPCARQPRACPRDNSPPMQARTTKCGQTMQNSLFKVPIILGVIDLDLQGQI